MSDVKPFTTISGDANGVDLEAERFSRDFGLPVQIFIPPCHPRSKYLSPLTHSQLGEAIPITDHVSNRLNKPLCNPVSLQYIHRNYHMVKQAEMVLAFTCFLGLSSIMVSISACHAEDLGSIPSRDVLFVISISQ